MRIPHLPFVFLFHALLTCACLAAPSNPGKEPILPVSFGGWQAVNPVQKSTNPAAADPVNAALLKEDGFTDFEGATYTREDGRKLTIKAARFADASGAYGAFTFYQTPEMLNEQIGNQGYSLNERILFYRGNILIDAIFQKLSAMSAAELRELAAGLPRPAGTAGNLPGLPAYLPKDSFQKNSTRYIVGPAGLEKIGSPLSAQYVDFSKGAEVVTGNYSFSGKSATLILISYPTPQMAVAELEKIQSAQQNHQLGDLQLRMRRSGPMLVLSYGSISESDANWLMSQVNYDADVTWSENTSIGRRNNPANLIVGVILLAAIVCGLSVLAGVAFGGFRVAMQRLLPGKVFDRPEQMEIIALHLSEPTPESRGADVSSSIKAG